MAFLKGQTLMFVKEEGHETIQWKQGSFLGLGGNMKQHYRICQYKGSSGAVFIVYVQVGFQPPTNMKIDSKIQYGMKWDVLFLVYHDKSQMPFQHRFMTGVGEMLLTMARAGLKVVLASPIPLPDPSWFVGDYLLTF